MNPESISFAARAKGPFALLKRATSIIRRYGLTPKKMNDALTLFAKTLQRFNCGASFPLTATTLKRNPHIITQFAEQDIEFAIHGYIHIDHTQLDMAQILEHLQRAKEIFSAAGIQVAGFRSPYLQWNDDLNAALQQSGFSYVSNQPFMWPALNAEDLSSEALAGYKRALDFYAPWRADAHLSLPRLEDDLVEIPVSLPDDEILLDRLGGSGELIAKTWRWILAQSYRRGELFTLQLHPERAFWCVDALSDVLAAAQTLNPSVWVARLDELAEWQRALSNAPVTVAKTGRNTWRISLDAPLSGAVILVQNLSVLEPTEPWFANYRRVKANTCTAQSDTIPIIGLSPACPPAMSSFLQQQGYIVQTSERKRQYSIYLEQSDFSIDDERPLLQEIERSDKPLAHLARWRDGARSTISITGDIDALTIKDYTLRFLGK